MAKVITTELQHSGASGANITLDSSKNVTCENNLTVDGTTTLTGAVTLPAGTTSDTLSHRNIINNGAMQISQRNTSFTGLTSGATYTLDRHQVSLSNAGTWTVTQDTDAPDGFVNSLKLLCTTGDNALTGADYIHIWHRIENQDCVRFANGTSSAKKWALSFWVKSNTTGTYTMEIYNGIANRGTSKAYTIDSADTWERKTLVYNADTTGTKFGATNVEGLRLYMYFGSGMSTDGGTFRDGAWDANVQANRKHPSQANLAAAANNYLNITGIQLEAADACTEFEHRTYAEELRRCQRYFHRTGKNSNAWLIEGYTDNTGTGGHATYNHPVTMRQKPSVSKNGTWGTNNFSSLSFNWRDQHATSVRLIMSSAGNGYAHCSESGSPVVYGSLEFDAEL